MSIWNTRQGHNDRVRVGPAETNQQDPKLCLLKFEQTNFELSNK